GTAPEAVSMVMRMGICGVRGLLAATLFVLVGCRFTADKSHGETPLRRVNVVIVTIDTLRADRLACYGYRLIETPTSTVWRKREPCLRMQSRRLRPIPTSARFAGLGCSTITIATTTTSTMTATAPKAAPC